METKSEFPSTLVIFGATGDLTHRKLLPALYFLEHHGTLPGNFSIIGAARRDKTDDEFRKEAQDSIKKFSRIKVNPKFLKKVLARISYHQLKFNNVDQYKSLQKHIKKKKNTGIIFYLATPPGFFDVIVKNLAAAKLAGCTPKYSKNKVAFEKPFGKNLDTAKKLNRRISKIFHEKQIFRIDHYLAKELVQNLIVMRFANSIFEPLWNTKHIDHVQITVAESLGIEGRGNYYDKNGSLRDVAQNHLMQLLCLTAMDCPKSLDADHIRDEKVRVLKSIAKGKHLMKESVKGQYTAGTQDNKKVKSYRDEKGVREKSTTSTYFAIKFHINNKKWKNVPFYVRTGKHLKERATEIVICYKNSHSKLFEEVLPNQLVIRVQPDEGIIFKFNAKVPGKKVMIEQVNMDFCHECRFGPNTAEAYERLFYDIIKNDQTLFTRWDEVEDAWEIIDRFRNAWHNKNPDFYKPGSWGPKKADKLIEKDNRKWIIPKKPNYALLQ